MYVVKFKSDALMRTEMHPWFKMKARWKARDAV